jgi:hypothetical protein
LSTLRGRVVVISSAARNLSLILPTHLTRNKPQCYERKHVSARL